MRGARAAAVVAVLVLAAATLILPAGRRPFLSDDVRYALLARDILERGDWLVPDLRGEPYLNKPQLYIWAIALVSRPGGRVTDFTAAVPSLVSSVLAVAGVMAIGRLLWGWPAGPLAGLLLVTTTYAFEIGHQSYPDVMMNAWMVWALYWLLRARARGWPAGSLVAFHLMVAGAVLSKGPPGLAPLVAAVVTVAAADGRRALTRLRPGIGGAILGATLAVWFLPYLTHHGAVFGSQVIRGQYLAWPFEGAVLGRLQSFPMALGYFLPWSILLAAAGPWWRRAPDEGRRRVGLWTVTLWVLIAVASRPKPRYLLPVYPGLALLAAEFVATAARRRGRTPARVGLIACALCLLAAVAASLSPLARLVEGENRAYLPDTPWERLAIVGLATAAAAFAVLAVRRGAMVAASTALALGLGGILLVEGVTYPPRFARADDMRALGEAAAAYSPPGAPIYAHPEARLSLDWYAGRRVQEIHDPDAVVARLASGASVLVVPWERWQALAPRAGPGWEVLARRHIEKSDLVVVHRAAR